MGCFVPIAQLAEHETFNFGVKGSSPFGYTKIKKKLFYKLNKIRMIIEINKPR